MTGTKNLVLASAYLTQHDSSYIEKTVLLGTDGPVISVTSGADSIVVIGFTITGGASDHGAGINCSNGYLILRNNYISFNSTGNWRTGYGGGVYATNSTAILIENRFEYNDSDYGGAIYATTSIFQIKRCYFGFNNAQEYGGALYISGSSVDIDQNTFIQNWAIQGGGAIECNGSGYIRNNIITGYVTPDWMYVGAYNGGAINCGGTLKILNNRIERHSGGEGGAIRCSNDVLICNNLIINNTDAAGTGIYIRGNPKIINNTFYGNDGSAVIYFKMGYPEVTNNIIWGNTLRNDWKSIHVESGIPSLVPVNFSDIQDGYEGTGNISVDPLFRDELSGDFHLESSSCGGEADSPCIDTGSPLYLDSVLGCLDGLGTDASDMGAYGGRILNPTAISPVAKIQNPVIPGVTISPNPFNSQTKIEFIVVSLTQLEIDVYNLLGAKVRNLFNGLSGPGKKTFFWDGMDENGIYTASGIYILSLRQQHGIFNQKLILLR